MGLLELARFLSYYIHVLVSLDLLTLVSKYMYTSKFDVRIYIFQLLIEADQLENTNQGKDMLAKHFSYAR